jgi:hypothetical protein
MALDLREGNENISALVFLTGTFVALYLIAGIVHPSLLGLGGADAGADADAPAAAAPARPNQNK